MAGPSFVLRGQRVVCVPDHPPVPRAIVVRDGRVEALLEPAAALPADLPVEDAGNAVISPGLVDSHVHVNEPGRTDWEGFETATRAAAAGGITTIVDMPLNSIPPTTTPAALAVKTAAAQGRCCIDYGFWGGLVRGNTGELLPLVASGVLGFKAFMIDSGVDEFPWADETTLRAGFERLAATGVPVLLHAELAGGIAVPGAGDDAGISVPAGTAADTAARTVAPPPGSRHYDHWLHSRPVQWETNAVRLLLRLAQQTGCRVHVVHLSAAAALPDLAAARAAGVPVTVETCPHYLTFASEDIPEGATHFKCAPPIRDHANRERLWRGLAAGEIDCIVSDHSPCTPALKKMESGDFDAAWGGIAGLQFGLAAVWTEMRARGRNLWDLARWMSAGPARLAGLARRKGAIAPGFDADFVVWDPDAPFTVQPGTIHHRHPVTPYAGRTLHGEVRATYVRGTCVFRHGEFTGARPGERLFRDPEPVSGVRMNQPTSAPRAPFTELPDLASARLGGRTLHCTDDFFAPMDNLLKPGPAVFLPHEYTDRGKWMDGWESRRKRRPGHDWCVIQLGAPGMIQGVNIDTAHFLGNYPPFAWVEATDAIPDAAGGGVAWHEIVPRMPLRGGSENLFPVTDERRFTHVRLHMDPDGGIARFRVHGIVQPDWAALRGAGGLVDLAAAVHGGSVVTCNDMFFGPKDNLIQPGRGLSMADGWETRRRREPGNDWIVVRLGRRGCIHRIDIDTAFFKGNFPDTASLEACSRGGQGLTPAEARDPALEWRTILPRTKLQADHVHTFEVAPPARATAVDHVRLSIFPDGGVSRLRVWCEPAWD